MYETCYTTLLQTIDTICLFELDECRDILYLKMEWIYNLVINVTNASSKYRLTNIKREKTNVEVQQIMHALYFKVGITL